MINSLYKKSLVFIILLLVVLGCIKNDIPYPKVFAGFETFEVEGQIGEPVIDNDSLTVTVQLAEKQDPANLNVTGYTLNEDIATVSPDPIEYKDYSNPVSFVVTSYQDYNWTVIITQDIEYKFVIENQVGGTEIDADAKTITAYVSPLQDLSDITILELKIGPEGRTEVTPSKDDESDFTKPVVFTAKYGDTTEEWTVTIENKECTPGMDDAEITELNLEGMISQTTSITGNTGNDTYAYLDVTFPEDQDLTAVTINSFEHSEGSDFSGDWEVGSTVDLSSPVELVFTSGSCITKRWIVRAHKAIQMPNSDFADWYTDSDLPYPGVDGGDVYWSTPNVKTAGKITETTSPVDDDGAKGGKYVKLETKTTGGFGFFPKIAAGTLFTGRFAIAGTTTETSVNSVSFGEELASRPLALNVRCSYTPETINYENNSSASSTEMDQGNIWVKLMYIEGDIDYDDGIDHDNFHLPKGAVILGEGEVVLDEMDWSEISIPIVYNIENADKTPTHIAVVSTASIDGESFTGGVGSTLLIDYIELEY